MNQFTTVCGRPINHPSRCVSIESYRKGISKTSDTGANARTRDRRMWLGFIKLAYGCTDCGYRYSAVSLDFDHLPGFTKVGGVSVLAKHADPKLMFDEISKCQIVCKNCHAIRTISRGQHITAYCGGE